MFGIGADRLLFLLTCLGCLIGLVVPVGELVDIVKAWLLVPVAIVAAGAVFLPNNWRQGLILTGVSAVAAVFAFEAFLVFFPGYFSGKQNTDVEERSMREVVEEFRSGAGVEKDAVPHLAPLTYLSFRDLNDVSPLPFGGIPDKFTVLCDENGYLATYVADHLGFNNEASWYQGDLENLLIGDSFAQGFCVWRSESFTGHLNAKGQRTVSLGYGANGPLIELATLREYAPDLKPAKIVWLFYEGNDLRNLKEEKKRKVLWPYLGTATPAQTYKLPEVSDARNKVLEALMQPADSGSSSLDIKGLLSLRLTRKMVLEASLSSCSVRRKFLKHEYEMFQKIMKQAGKTASELGAELHLVYLPEFSRFHAGSDFDDCGKKTDIAAFSKENKINFVDLSTVAVPSRLREFFPVDQVHYGPEGYGVLSGMLAKAIK